MALVTLRFRRGTASQWTTANPVLGLGEPGWETDTHTGKVGDGVTAWTSLAYSLGAGGGGGGAVDSVNTRTGDVILTKSDVGLSNVDNTADSVKAVLAATKLSTARAIAGVSFDGTANITPRIDQLAAPTAAVSMGNQKITNGATPTAGTDYVIKTYADGLVNAKLTYVVWDGTGSQPARPVTAAGVPVMWFSPVQPTGGGTVGGGTGSVNGLDYWMKTV